MTTYRLTFGHKYFTEEHPTLPRGWANPKGYIMIEAPTDEIALRIAYGLCWNEDHLAYSNLDVYKREYDVYYPDGINAVITANAVSPAQSGASA